MSTAFASPATFNAFASHETFGKTRIWTGRIATGLVATFLLFDAGCKLLLVPMVLEASAKLGFTPASIFGIGLVLFLSTIIHLIPRTALLGAVLLTGYLGGAICTHVQHGDGAFSIVFAGVFGVLVWVGLYLRDARVVSLIQPKRA